MATYILIPLVKVLSDGGDEVQYQGFCLIFDIDGASSIKIFTLLSIFVWVKLVVPKSDLFLCTVLQPSMSRSVHKPLGCPYSLLVRPTMADHRENCLVADNFTPDGQHQPPYFNSNVPPTLKSIA